MKKTTVSREESDERELYDSIYRSIKKDYKRLRQRELVKKLFSLTSFIFAFLGVFSICFYLFFFHERIGLLHREIEQYKEKVALLEDEVSRLSTSEQWYKDQIEKYEYTFSNLKIEDDRIVDFDLSDSVKQYVEGIEDSPKEYRNITRGNTLFKETALTFDLGTGEDLPFFYSVLKKYNITATIFISNEMPSLTYGSLFKRKNITYLIKLGNLGCEFANHTWSHYNLRRSLYETSKKKRLNLSFVSDNILDEITLKREFDRVRDKFYSETGFQLSPFWRAPYGEIDHKILTIAARAGYPNHVLWSSNKMGPLDFYDYITSRFIWVKDRQSAQLQRKINPYYFSSSEMLARLREWERVDKHGLNGSIAISHLGTSRKSDKMIYILPDFISYCKSRGYHFVVVSKVINDIQDY